MKILLVNKFARVTGGADAHCVTLTNLLRGRGHDVRWLSTWSESNIERSGSFARCSYASDVDRTPSVRRSAHVALHGLWNREAAALMRREVAQFQPDVIHLHKLYPQLSASAIHAVPRSVPVVQTIHDHEFVSANPYERAITKRSPNRRLLLLLGMYAVRSRLHVPRPHVWISPSRYLAGLHEFLHDVVVVPNAVERSLANVPREDRQGIAYAGALTVEKGARELIHIARQVAPVRLTIAGAGPVEAEIRSARLSNVVLLGRLSQSEVRQLFRSSLAVVVPSQCDEAGPLVVLEALSEGTPVVGSKRGALPEYIGAGGLTASTTSRLAEAIALLVSDHVEWARASAWGRARIEDAHCLEKHVLGVEAAYGLAAIRAAGNNRGRPE